MTEVDEIRAKIKEYRLLVDTCDDPIGRQIHLATLNGFVERLADIALSSQSDPERRSGKDRRQPHGFRALSDDGKKVVSGDALNNVEGIPDTQPTRLPG